MFRFKHPYIFCLFTYFMNSFQGIPHSHPTFSKLQTHSILFIQLILSHFIRTVSDDTLSSPDSSPPATPHKRRVRYSGRNPRRFEEKYKERDPQRYADTVAKVLASGKTPAGTHRPIMVTEILAALAPKPGELAVDCTLGYGGHAQEILACLQPSGRLLGLDADPVELPKTEARLRAAGFGPEMFTAIRSNFAGLPQALTEFGVRNSEFGMGKADCILT